VDFLAADHSIGASVKEVSVKYEGDGASITGNYVLLRVGDNPK